jgi:hypothetical protein
MRVILTIIVITFCIFSSLKAKNSTDSLSFPKNSVYVDGSFLIFMGSASLNYERIISENRSIRGGLGVSYVAAPNPAGGSVGSDAVNAFTIMYNYFTPGRHKFEAGGWTFIPDPRKV